MYLRRRNNLETKQLKLARQQKEQMGYSLRAILHISRVRSLAKKQETYGKEFRRQKREQEAKKGSGPQPGCLALQNSLRKRTLPPLRRWGYQNEGKSLDRH